MLLRIAGALALLGCLIAPARADEKTKAALVDELIQTSGAEKNFDRTLDLAVASGTRIGLQAGGAGTPEDRSKMQSTKAFQEYMDAVRAVIKQTMSWDAMKPELAKIYMDSFTEEELGSLVAFYKSPGGKALVTKMPQVMQRSMELSQKMVQPAIPQVQQLAKDFAAKVVTESSAPKK